MRPELSRRLARALDVGLATVEERVALLAAAQKVKTFDDLPEDMQALVVRLETPPTSAGVAAVPEPAGESGEAPTEPVFSTAVLAWFQSRMPPQLQAYWIRELRLGADGSFDRCVRELREYFPEDTEGLCANLYKTATGRWPSQKKDAAADLEAFAATDVDVVVDAAEVDALEPQPGEHFHTWVLEGVSTGLRQFAPGAITWREPPFAYHWQWKSSAHNGLPETVQTGIVTRVVRDGNTVHFFGRLDLRSPEGLDYARRVAEGFARWSSVGADESTKDKHIDIEYVLSEGGEVPELTEDPEVDLMTFREYRVAEVTGVSVPALADALVEATPELIETLTTMGVLEPQAPTSTPAGDEAQENTMPNTETPSGQESLSVVVAAGRTITLPDAPPAAWFDEPADDELPPYGSIRVDADGRLIGLLAPAQVNHRSFPGKRVKVPMGNVDYSGWQNKAREVAEGHTINVGVITMDCGHASTNPGDWSYTHRQQHYDNACSIAAHARAYEKPGIGVALAGAIAPWLDADGFGRLLSSDLSGDWPPHPDRPGWRDFIAALAVPVGGFPHRARVRVAEGALVAAAVPVHFNDDMEAPMDDEELLEVAAFVEGDRVRVVNPDGDVTEGEIALVHDGPVYALTVEGRDESARWYVAEDLELADSAAEPEPVEEIADEVVAASASPAGTDLRPAMDFVARKVGRDPASRMAALRDRIHPTD